MLTLLNEDENLGELAGEDRLGELPAIQFDHVRHFVRCELLEVGELWVTNRQTRSDRQADKKITYRQTRLQTISQTDNKITDNKNTDKQMTKSQTDNKITDRQQDHRQTNKITDSPGLPGLVSATSRRNSTLALEAARRNSPRDLSCSFSRRYCIALRMTGGRACPKWRTLAERGRPNTRLATGNRQGHTE